MIDLDWNVSSEHPGTLLLVDDEELNRDMLTRRLALDGYSVTAIESGRGALNLVRQKSFDLVLLDVMMPDMDGLDVLKVLRGAYSPAELPVIMVTAKGHSGDIVNALNLGANDYVTKPLDIQVLQARVGVQISHKRALEAQRASEMRFQTLTESMPQLVWSCLPDGHCDYLSRQWLDYTGIDEVDQLGDGWIQAVHPDDREQVWECWRGAVEGRRHYDVAYRLGAADGSYRWFQARGSVQRDDIGRFVRWFGTCTDIDDQRRAERANIEVAERMRSIVDNVADGVFTIDESGLIQSVNIAGERQFGYEARAMIGQDVSTLMPELNLLAHDSSLARFLDTGPARIVAGEAREVGGIRELNGLRSDGSIFPMELTVGKFRSGGRLYFTGVIRDITERKQTEEALRTYARRLVNLRSIDLAILSARSPYEVAETALHHLAKLIPCWTGSITTFDVARGKVEFIAFHGLLGRRFSPGDRFPLSNLADSDLKVLRSGRALVVEELRGVDLSDDVMESLRAEGLRSYIMLPLMERGILIGSLNLGSDVAAAYSLDAIEMARELADHLALAIRQALLHEEVRSAQERLEGLSRELLRAQEDERRRIARELHDQIGQSLTALKINLQDMSGIGADESRRLDESVDIVDQTLQQVRGMALDLRPPLLDDLGLVSTLEWFVERHAQRTSLQGRFFADPEEIVVDAEINIACFRVVQEALTNVARHARARSFRVELLQHSAGLQLVVRDDGIGFDTERVAAVASFGLSGMRERVELVGGTFAIVSEAGIGTEIQVGLPNAPPVVGRDPA